MYLNILLDKNTVYPQKTNKTQKIHTWLNHKPFNIIKRKMKNKFIENTIVFVPSLPLEMSIL